MSQRFLIRLAVRAAILAVVVFPFSLRAQEAPTEDRAWHEELAQRIGSYEAAKEKVLLPIEELRSAYLAQLEKIRKASQERGSLEEAVLVDAEIAAVRAGTPNDKEGSFDELDRARNTFESLRERKTRELASQLERIERTYLQSLETYQAGLTKSGQIEWAVEVKEYLQTRVEKKEAASKPVIFLFWSPNFEGEPVQLEVPIEISRFAFDDRVYNDRLASIRIPEGVVVTISPTANLEGDRTKLYRDESKLELGTSSLRAELRP
ncbi:MAG: hypothetical protein AAF491_02675 [Verrucomicrobiota bacterium]